MHILRDIELLMSKKYASGTRSVQTIKRNIFYYIPGLNIDKNRVKLVTPPSPANSPVREETNFKVILCVF